MLKGKHILRILSLLAMLLLLAGVPCAFAQNNGTSPYLGSQHAYQLKIGKVANTKQWRLTDKASTPTTYDLTAVSWATYTAATADGGNDIVTIWFLQSVFTTTGTWYLQYSENQIQSDGTTICVSAREMKIDLVENTFYLELSSNSEVCNSQSGAVHSYDEVDAESFATTVTYTVTMNKQLDFDINQWEFDAIFSQSITSFVATITTTNGGTLTNSTVATDDDSIHVVVTPPTSGQPNSVVVTLTVTYSNPVLADVTRSVDIHNGLARSGAEPYPWVYTNDNIVTYPVSPATPGDREQSITINAVPSTRDITYGSGETAWSAEYPSQSSTHNYKVQMGNATANYATGSSWTLLDASGGAVTSSYYTITTTQSVDSALASIYYSSSLAAGTYIIAFTETSTDGCSTIRHDTITLVGPMVVDISTTQTAQCPDVSGNINDTSTAATQTVVSFTVALTSDYRANWSFNFALTSSPVFGTDLDVFSIAVGSTGATYTSSTATSGTVSVTNTESSSVKSVTVVVTYDGLYDNEHAITATISNILGQFGENNATGTHTLTHTIYRLPQPLAIEGID